MTKEEARERLRGILTEAVEFENSVCYVTEEDREPFAIAIKVLEQGPCEDAISRQAIKRLLENRFMELQKRHDDKRYETNYCLNTILELPSVNSQPNTGH